MGSYAVGARLARPLGGASLRTPGTAVGAAYMAARIQAAIHARVRWF